MMSLRSALLSLCVASAAAAQDPVPRPLPPVSAEHPEGVSSVSGFAELPDGRVLVSDAKEGVLRLLSFEDGSAREPASRGRGPREYASAGGLYRQRNGDVWLLDAPQRRYLVLSSRGAPLRTVPFAQSQGGGFSMRSDGDPHVVDGRGREYERARPGARGATQDSAPLMRRDAERTDTLAMLRNPTMVTSTAMGASITALQRFSPMDGFAVGEDGTVALVRAEPYRVDWRGPSGALRRGPPLSVEAVPVTAADRDSAERAARASMQGANLPRITQQGPDGTPREVDLRAMMPEVPQATHKPPFEPRRLRIDRAGRLWVGRSLPQGTPAVYDVFDASGRRIDRVQLPPGYRLVGFGEGRAYVARIDADGLLFIGRAPYEPPA